jgi:hypothetical protein
LTTTCAVIAIGRSASSAKGTKSSTRERWQDRRPSTGSAQVAVAQATRHARDVLHYRHETPPAMQPVCLAIGRAWQRDKDRCRTSGRRWPRSRRARSRQHRRAVDIYSQCAEVRGDQPAVQPGGPAMPASASPRRCRRASCAGAYFGQCGGFSR